MERAEVRDTVSRAAALFVTIATGIAVRYAPLPLPWVVSKYLGSALWAIALYLFIALLMPRYRPALVAAVAVILIELSRLVPEPHIDHFRTTLGRYFLWKNIAAYRFEVILAAAVDNFRPTGKWYNSAHG